MLLGADRRDVDDPRARGRGGAGHRFRPFGLDRVEPLAAAFEQDADQIDDDSASRTAASTDCGKRTLAWTAWIWPTRPSGCKWPVSSGRRTATRMRYCRLASARTRWRPRKPEPPNTVTSVSNLLFTAIAGRTYRNGSALYRGAAHDPESGDRLSKRSCGNKMPEPGSEWNPPVKALARSIDNEKTAQYLSRHCPGGGIGRRTSFRY